MLSSVIIVEFSKWTVAGLLISKGMCVWLRSDHLDDCERTLGVKTVNKQSQILRRRILKKSVAGLQVLFLAHFSFNLGKITYMSRGSCILYIYRKKTPYFSCLNLVLSL